MSEIGDIKYVKAVLRDCMKQLEDGVKTVSRTVFLNDSRKYLLLQFLKESCLSLKSKANNAYTITLLSKRDLLAFDF